MIDDTLNFCVIDECSYWQLSWLDIATYDLIIEKRPDGGYSIRKYRYGRIDKYAVYSGLEIISKLARLKRISLLNLWMIYQVTTI